MMLLPYTAIAAGVANQLGAAIPLRRTVRHLVVEATFAYGAGGTTVKAWVQTRVVGATWRDIMCFAFTTAAAKKWLAVSALSITAAVAASDAALADDTAVAGLLGDEIRVKYTTTGTYTGATTLTVVGQVKE